LKYITILISLFLIACTNTQNINPSINKSNNKILQFIKNGDLDSADEEYIKIKDTQDSTKIKDSATILAIAHIENNEYILANFFIQEGLSIDSSDEFLKFLLIKNQFLSANEHNNDLSYIKKALKALEENSYLISDNEYKTLTSTMITRLKIDIAKRNKDIANQYKSLNKIQAYKIYKQKIEDMGFDSKDIIK